MVVVAALVGFWAGVSAWGNASFQARAETGLAVFIGSNLLFCLWLWYRAKPDSGDAMALPAVVLLSASMLVGILPRLFWPDAEGIRIAASIASTIVPIVLIIMQIRRWRRLRQAKRPV